MVAYTDMARWRFLLQLGLVVGLYAMRYVTALPEFDVSYLGSYREKFLQVQGKVVEAGFAEDVFVLDAFAFEEFGNMYGVFGRLRVYGNFDVPFRRGDVLTLRGKLEAPFRYDPRIAAVLKRPTLLAHAASADFDVAALLADLRQFLVARLNRAFPYPVSGFASGILFGGNVGIPKDVFLDFQRTGLTHILAVSGFNIVILIAAFAQIFSVLPKKKSVAVSLLCLAAFVLLTGASASVVRAAIMGALTLLARLFGRRSAGLRALIITGYVMIMIDPFLLIFDIGFQLSFAATAGILIFSKRIEKIVQFLPERFAIRSSAATTLSAQLATLPITMFYFGGFSTIAPLSNLIVLPFIPYLMLGSFLALFFGKIAAAPTWVIFEMLLMIIHFFAELPFAFIG